MSKKLPTTYWSLLRYRFLQHKGAKWSIRLLLFTFLLAFLGNFIAGDIPIYCQLNQEHYFPAFKKYAVDAGLTSWTPPFHTKDWRNLPYESVFYPLIPYSSESTDKKNRHYKSPFDTQEVPSRKFHHWLGTDGLGRDVAAGMLSGLQTALLVGLLSMLIASLIGISLGALAGYFGDDGWMLSIGRLLFLGLGLLLGIHWGFIARSYIISEGNFIVEVGKGIGVLSIVLMAANALGHLIEGLPFFSKKIAIPLDLLVMRLVEIMNSVPALLLILALTVVIETSSVFTIIFLIGIVRWTGITRFVRAELLRIRSMGYIQSAKAMGFSPMYILIRYALPNAMGPVLITIAFGIAAAILAEATLSFLGIGVPAGQVTWGSLLKNAKEAWWLALFPGLGIFMMVLMFNLIGEGLKEAVDRRM